MIPPHFFREGQRLNSDACVELLITVVKPWITRVANVGPFGWQLDLAPCHTSGKSKKWLLAIFFDYTSPNVWPSNSPWIIMCGSLMRKRPIAVPVLQKRS